VAKVPELVRTKQQVFSIPFRLAPPQTADQAPQRVLLNVSKDLGGTWEPAGEAAPAAGSITYRAGADGEYWFRLRSIDGKGRTRGGEGPDVRVLVDAAGPRIAARVWRGGDGEIICRYAAIDDSLKMESLEFEYHGKADQGWKKIAAEGILSRESPAHMVGEEIWWAGEQVDFMQVRIAITDAAGNRSTKQFTMEPTDPGVDQAGLARELGVPPLPGEVPSQAAAQTSLPPAPAAPPPPAGWRQCPAGLRGARRCRPRLACGIGCRLLCRPADAQPGIDHQCAHPSERAARLRAAGVCTRHRGGGTRPFHAAGAERIPGQTVAIGPLAPVCLGL